MTSTTSPPQAVTAESRVRGAVWGRFVGDAAALGSHWIYDLDELRRRFPGGPLGFEAPAAGHYHDGKKPGDQTHYGDGALLLLDSVAAAGEFDVAAFGTEFLARFRPGVYPGYLDNATKGTVANYDAFVADRPAAEFDFQRGADDDHPGTVARSAIVVARHYRDEDVLDRVETLTRFAQDNPRALAYTRADAVLLRRLLLGAPVDEALAEVAREFAAPTGQAPAEQAAAVLDALARARADLHRDPVEATLDYGQSCPLPNTFPAAVQILLGHPGDFAGAVLAALRGGGDSAGRAALVGGWLGAHLGVEAIPAAWRERLTSAPRITEALDRVLAATPH